VVTAPGSKPVETAEVDEPKPDDATPD